MDSNGVLTLASQPLRLTVSNNTAIRIKPSQNDDFWRQVSSAGEDEWKVGNLGLSGYSLVRPNLALRWTGAIADAGEGEEEEEKKIFFF
jgi:hypothetical protein